MVKALNFLGQFRDKHWQLVLSPTKLSLFNVTHQRGGLKIHTTAEINGSFISPDRFLSQNFRAALQTLAKRYQPTEVGLSLNLSNFFTRSFTVPSLKGGDVNEIIALKIQNEIPIALERYYWAIQKLYTQTETKKFLVVFYQREIIEAVNQILLSEHILPLVVEPNFLSLLRYLQTRLSFVVDSSYIIFVFSNSILLSLTYEDNQIQNVFAEMAKVQDSEVEQLFQRTLNFLKTKLTKPLQNILLVTDTALTIPTESKSQVINLQELTNNTAEEMFALGLAERLHHLPENLGDLNLNLINPLQEYTLSRLRSVAILWTGLVLLVGLIVNILVLRINQKLQATTSRIKQTLDQNQPSFKLEQFKQQLKTFNASADQLLISQGQPLLLPTITQVLTSDLNQNLAELSVTNQTIKFKFRVTQTGVANLIERLKTILPNASLTQTTEGKMMFIEAQVQK